MPTAEPGAWLAVWGVRTPWRGVARCWRITADHVDGPVLARAPRLIPLCHAMVALFVGLILVRLALELLHLAG